MGAKKSQESKEALALLAKGVPMAEAARLAGVSYQYLSRLRSARRRVSEKYISQNP